MGVLSLSKRHHFLSDRENSENKWQIIPPSVYNFDGESVKNIIIYNRVQLNHTFIARQTHSF